MDIIPEDGVHATIRNGENIIDVWDCDQYALSLDLDEARHLVDQITDVLASTEPGPAADAFRALRRLAERAASGRLPVSALETITMLVSTFDSHRTDGAS